MLWLAHPLTRARTPYSPAKGDAIHTDGRVDVNVASVGRQIEGKLLERALLSGAHHEGLEALIVRVDHKARAAVEAEAKDARGRRLERVVDELTVRHLAHGELVDGEAEGRDRIKVDVAADVLACIKRGQRAWSESAPPLSRRCAGTYRLRRLRGMPCQSCRREVPCS